MSSVCKLATGKRFLSFESTENEEQENADVADSLFPAGSTGVTPAPVVRTDPSVATTSGYDDINSNGCDDINSGRIGHSSSSYSSSYPSVPVNSFSVPVVSTPAPFATATTVAVPVPFSVVPASTAETAILTIDTAASDTSSESSSSSGSGSMNPPSVVITTPLTLAPLCTMGSDCNDNGGLLLEASSADSSGPKSAADGSLGPTPSSALAADVEVSESAGSFTGSESLSNGSIPIGTVGNSSETRPNSTGSVVTLIDEATGASINGSLASSPETAFLDLSSNSGSDELSNSGSIAVNSVKNGSLDDLGNSSVESSTEDYVNATGSAVTLIDRATGASINGSLASSPETAFLDLSSNSGSDELSNSGLIAVNSVKNGSLDDLGNSSVESSTEDYVNATGSAVTLIDEATSASINGSLASSPETAFFDSSSNSGSDEPSNSSSIAVNSVKNGSLDDLGNSSVESSTEDYVVPKSSLSRSSSSILPPSHSSEVERLTPVPIESPWSKGVLQLSPITDDDNENPPPSTDGGLPPVNGTNTDKSNNALGLKVMLFITVGSVVAVALIFGVFYLRPKRAITHELLTPEPPRPMDRTGAYPYDHSLELESTGPYDASSTPRTQVLVPVFLKTY